MITLESTTPNVPQRQPQRRVTPLSARGEPVVWITGMAMALCMAMIVSLLAISLFHGSRTFWQQPIDTVTLRDGSVFLGLPVRDEAFDPGAEDTRALEALREGSEQKIDASAFDDDGRPIRRLYRVGNREFYGEPFRWIPLYQIKIAERSPEAVMLERLEWGWWLGYPEAVVRQEEVELPAGQMVELAGTDSQGRRFEQALLAEAAGGAQRVSRRTYLAEGDATWDYFKRAHPESRATFRQIEHMRRHDVGRVNYGLESARLRLRQAEIDLGRAQEPHGQPLGMVAWSSILVVGLFLLAAALGLTLFRERMLGRKGRDGLSGRMFAAASWCGAVLTLAACWLEHPWSAPDMTPEKLATVRTWHDEQVAGLNAEYSEILGRIRALEAEDGRTRVLVREPLTGKLAPIRQTEPDEPLVMSQVVLGVQPNTLTFAGKVGVYFERWREFLFDEPRDTNTAGGIYPVIFGTVLLTLLLSVAVVPLGVVAALYMREYAKQGLVISIVRIAVNNLAGVPSIVYGVFGLGFFCYTVGVYVDIGPAATAPRWSWWIGVMVLAVLALAASWLSLFARPKPGTKALRWQKVCGVGASVLWGGSALAALSLVATTPYFHGFFEAKQPGQVFGGRGLLWASLTLALLTLPVVIVSTEEAIAAVPRTMREGSYGCGASKWQTIRRIVLPRAMPGIMTGMILAMARGAGEVALLMLVGAVKLAPELPLSTEFPYLHLDRSFMHLGFHIYDVGFQSPDSEAARPLVWSTTIVLIAIVLLLNMTAIRIRSKLRQKFLGGAF